MAGGLLRRDGIAAAERAPERRETASALPEAAWAAIRDEISHELPDDWASLIEKDPVLRREAEGRIAQAVDTQVRQYPGVSRAVALAEARAEFLGVGPLQDLLDDQTVTEIMVDSPNDVRVERNGRLSWTEVRFRSEEHLRMVISKIVSPLHREVTESEPLVDGRLPDGSRIHVVVPPLRPDGAAVTIRKFPQKFDVTDLVANRSMSPEIADLLGRAVRARTNILVSGGTSSGKTTTLNALSAFIPEDERIITIEDTLELRLERRGVVAMEARPANSEGRGEVTIRQLVKNALRMRPDRIIVGEVRGGEALDMLQAMNTGHDGSLTTLHANSARDVLSRLETLVLMAGFDLPVRAIREQIASAMELVVQVERSADGRRRVVEVAEVAGLIEGDVRVDPIVQWDGADWVPTGHRPERLLAKFRRAGVEAPARLVGGREAAD